MTTATSFAAPPGPRLPRALQLPRFVVRPGGVLARSQARYGDIFTLRIEPHADWVVVSEPDAVAAIFRMGPQDFRAGTDILRPVLGDHSLLTLDGEEHLRQRRLLLPPFHGDRMQRYREVVRDATLAALDRMPQDRPFALREHTQAITLDVILRAVFGVEGAGTSRLRRRLERLLHWLSGPAALLAQTALGPDSRLARAHRSTAVDPVDVELRRLITQRRAAPDLDERDDILSMLLLARDEDGGAMTDVELRDELLTLLVAGHETTATGLAWAMERLTRTPQTLDRLSAEARAGGSAYTDAVVKETLRLRPVVMAVMRTLEADTVLAGHALPARTKVVASIYLMHRRPELYPEPFAFRPERFLGGDGPSSAYAWIPFGGGIRRCIGAAFAQMEMEVVLQTLVAQARFAPVGPPEHAVRRSVTRAPQRGGEVVMSR
ncbi:unannotated protein [freshwater metagenome]|uniref:Unannotated protein n=1 Tax=freshwater metagenome TaxID=449393 RepID=A0A6J7IWY0_9ZZZZ|nr:cytochrome P450 [Actinomycetota bacterium]